MIKQTADELWRDDRELRARIKAAFEREGIELPVTAQAVVLHPTAELRAAGADGPAPPG